MIEIIVLLICLLGGVILIFQGNTSFAERSMQCVEQVRFLTTTHTRTQGTACAVITSLREGCKSLPPASEEFQRCANYINQLTRDISGQNSQYVNAISSQRNCRELSYNTDEWVMMGIGIGGMLLAAMILLYSINKYGPVRQEAKDVFDPTNTRNIRQELKELEKNKQEEKKTETLTSSSSPATTVATSSHQLFAPPAVPTTIPTPITEGRDGLRQRATSQQNSSGNRG